MTKKQRFVAKNSDPRNAKYRILVVCEGKRTEPLYFESLSTCPERCWEGVVVEIQDVGQSPSHVVQRAIALRNAANVGYDRVWAVFDKDDFTAEEFNGAIEHARNDEIECAWSNEAFELWFLLHFHYHDVATSRSDYSRMLHKRLAAPYAKNQVDVYDKILSAGGSTTRAIGNAKTLEEYWGVTDTHYAGHNPRTKVFALVEDMLGMGEFWRIGVDR